MSARTREVGRDLAVGGGSIRSWIGSYEEAAMGGGEEVLGFGSIYYLSGLPDISAVRVLPGVDDKLKSGFDVTQEFWPSCMLRLCFNSNMGKQRSDFISARNPWLRRSRMVRHCLDLRHLCRLPKQRVAIPNNRPRHTKYFSI